LSQKVIILFLNIISYNLKIKIIIKMKKLEKEYEVDRFDIKTSEKKIFKKYTDTIKEHEVFDVRIEENNSNELISIKQFSLQKIFSLIDEYPEEHILFLYLNPDINKRHNQIDVSLPIIELNNQLNSSIMRLEPYDSETPTSSKHEIQKYSKSNQILCLFSIIYFIIGGLLLIHFLQFLFSKEVRINFNYICMLLF
jgi:hypothetical protein